MTPDAAPAGLDRFVSAQDPSYETALAELKAGRKRSHWMWFVFPQLRGLGLSPTARHFGIASLAEARAYLGHPVLGPRLLACTGALLDGPERNLLAILGPPDDLKLRSCMTLFARAAGPEDGQPFRDVLDRFCGGEEDPRTVALLGGDVERHP